MLHSLREECGWKHKIFLIDLSVLALIYNQGNNYNDSFELEFLTAKGTAEKVD